MTKTQELTMNDLQEFLDAHSYEDQLKILLIHSEKNRKIIEIRRKKQMDNNDEFELEKKDISEQFTEFLRTKGIKAKFRLAFANMKESAYQQHLKDKNEFEERKTKSIEENKDFVEFIHTKGIKAKFHLVIENIKKGARESREKTKKQIDASKHDVHKEIIQTSSDLEKEFNAFLKAKGLDEKYIVVITEE
ncbi:MAG: hypothetical protein J1F31_03275 [Erysipelotrichales bacterium]|nr:hypothetical protein [Erysipelotrichales bacterium]